MNYHPHGDSLIYQKKFEVTKGLINYWAFNGNVNDVVGNSNLYGGFNAGLTSDRFGIPDSALNLTNGYLQVPPGVYFNGTELSIMSWVKPRSFRKFSRLIDFGNGADQDNVFLSLCEYYYSLPHLDFIMEGNKIWVLSTKQLQLNQWQHLAGVYSFPYLYIYIDGILATPSGSKTTLPSFSLKNVVRTSNFLGRSNWYPSDEDTNADIDDLKIFNRALSQQEIQFEMNNSL
jgi:hypothetical protein